MMKVPVAGKCAFEWFTLSMSTVMLTWHLVRATNPVKGMLMLILSRMEVRRKVQSLQ